MREYLAFLCCEIFEFFYNLAGTLDGKIAIGRLETMFRRILAVARKEVRQERYREAMKDKIRTPGR